MHCRKNEKLYLLNDTYYESQILKAKTELGVKKWRRKEVNTSVLSVAP